MEGSFDASVVIATRDRRDDLRRCLAALAAQRTAYSFEVVVVDDGSDPPIGEDEVAQVPSGRLVRGEGRGPGRARNLGVAEARAPVVLFTDDDTVPVEGWVEAALTHLRDHPEEVGVEGPIVSLPYDPLYEISLEARTPGSYYTANVGYRREVIERLGGFRSELFPMAHCEDLDLGYRAEALGAIGYAQGMTVEHVPRPITVMGRVRRARMSQSEVVLKHEHAERYGLGARLPGPVFAVVNGLRYYWDLGRSEGATLLRRPTRLARLVAMAAGHTLLTVAVTLRRRHP